MTTDSKYKSEYDDLKRGKSWFNKRICSILLKNLFAEHKNHFLVLFLVFFVFVFLLCWGLNLFSTSNGNITSSYVRTIVFVTDESKVEFLQTLASVPSLIDQTWTYPSNVSSVLLDLNPEDCRTIIWDSSVPTNIFNAINSRKVDDNEYKILVHTPSYASKKDYGDTFHTLIPNNIILSVMVEEVKINCGHSVTLVVDDNWSQSPEFELFSDVFTTSKIVIFDNLRNSASDPIEIDNQCIVWLMDLKNTQDILDEIFTRICGSSVVQFHYILDIYGNVPELMKYFSLRDIFSCISTRLDLISVILPGFISQYSNEYPLEMIENMNFGDINAFLTAVKRATNIIQSNCKYENTSEHAWQVDISAPVLYNTNNYVYTFNWHVYKSVNVTEYSANNYTIQDGNVYDLEKICFTLENVGISGSKLEINSVKFKIVSSRGTKISYSSLGNLPIEIDSARSISWCIYVYTNDFVSVSIESPDFIVWIKYNYLRKLSEIHNLKPNKINVILDHEIQPTQNEEDIIFFSDENYLWNCGNKVSVLKTLITEINQLIKEWDTRWNHTPSRIKAWKNQNLCPELTSSSDDITYTQRVYSNNISHYGIPTSIYCNYDSDISPIPLGSSVLFEKTNSISKSNPTALEELDILINSKVTDVKINNDLSNGLYGESSTIVDNLYVLQECITWIKDAKLRNENYKKWLFTHFINTRNQSVCLLAVQELTCKSII
mgnify:CR=1 FL=1|jgi:hypothetical protein